MGIVLEWITWAQIAAIHDKLRNSKRPDELLQTQALILAKLSDRRCAPHHVAEITATQLLSKQP